MKNLTKRHIAAVTDPWVRTKADEEALASGLYWFDLLRGTFPIWWVEKHCRLYQGEWSGKRLLFRSHAPTEPDWWEFAPADWRFDPGTTKKTKAIYDHCVEWSQYRAAWHLERIKKGLHVDWQYEGHVRLYGWATVEPHKKWGRRVRRFKSANFWAAKKNKKTPTMGGILHYHLSGDGEAGAGCFVSAKDGGQAGRVIQHAQYMREQSPELMAFTTYHASHNKLRNPGRRALAEVLTSGNKRHEEAKEGHNGSLLLKDEVHLISASLMEQVERMGISRAEFLALGYSTAGDDSESYGKGEWDRGEAVNNWDVKARDFAHLHLSYHIPEKLTDAEFARAPVKFGKMANPAWGDTIDPAEFKADWEKSRYSPRKRNKFFQLRCNKWVRSTFAMIDMEAWDRGRAPRLTVDDLAGLGGGIGLDYARKDDFAAFVFSVNATDSLLKKLRVPMEIETQDGIIDRSVEKCRIFWAMTFCPLPRLDELASEHPQILEWLEAGELIGIDNRVIHNSHVIDHIEPVIDLIGSRCLVSDRTFAGELLDYLDKRFAALDIVEMKQTLHGYAAATESFDALTKECHALHNGNRCYRWQIANMYEYERGGLRKPVKPPNEPNRKIDAGQASIMANDACETAGRIPQVDWSNYSGPVLI